MSERNEGEIEKKNGFLLVKKTFFDVIISFLFKQRKRDNEGNMRQNDSIMNNIIAYVSRCQFVCS